jgi:hypothetical protein
MDELFTSMESVMKIRSILSLVIILGMAGCSATPSAMTEAATMPPTSVPPATAAPTSTVAPIVESMDEPTARPISKTKSFPAARCCNGTPVEPGEYELPSWMGIALTMELGEGWQVVNEKDARLFMLGKGESIFNDPTQALVFIAIPKGDPQAILSSIRNDPGLTAQGEMSEITVAGASGGLSGLQLDLFAKPNPDYEGDKDAEIPPGVQFLPSVGQYFAEGFFWTTWSAEAHLRFIVLDLGEHVLLLQMDSQPAEFEAFASEAEQVLQTLKVRR